MCQEKSYSYLIGMVYELDAGLVGQSLGRTRAKPGVHCMGDGHRTSQKM